MPMPTFMQFLIAFTMGMNALLGHPPYWDGHAIWDPHRGRWTEVQAYMAEYPDYKFSREDSHYFVRPWGWNGYDNGTLVWTVDDSQNLHVKKDIFFVPLSKQLWIRSYGLKPFIADSSTVPQRIGEHAAWTMQIINRERGYSSNTQELAKRYPSATAVRYATDGSYQVLQDDTALASGLIPQGESAFDFSKLSEDDIAYLEETGDLPGDPTVDTTDDGKTERRLKNQLMLACLVDAETTNIGIAHGAAELNPLLRGVVQKLGPVGFLAASVAYAVWLPHYLKKHAINHAAYLQAMRTAIVAHSVVGVMNAVNR